MNSGDFDKTVILKTFTEAAADGLGHKAKTFTAYRKCAARLWTRSSGERSTDPGEFNVGDLQLLLYRPPSNIAPGWRLTYQSEDYEITNQDWRDRELTLLVTLARV